MKPGGSWLATSCLGVWDMNREKQEIRMTEVKSKEQEVFPLRRPSDCKQNIDPGMKISQLSVRINIKIDI